MATETPEQGAKWPPQVAIERNRGQALGGYCFVGEEGAAIAAELVRLAEADQSIDTGDAVLHGPSGETWGVAYVEGNKLAWLGWPEGEADLSDCTLVHKATAEERLTLLRAIANPGGGDYESDRRVRYARRLLEKLGVTKEAPELNEKGVPEYTPSDDAGPARLKAVL